MLRLFENVVKRDSHSLFKTFKTFLKTFLLKWIRYLTFIMFTVNILQVRFIVPKLEDPMCRDSVASGFDGYENSSFILAVYAGIVTGIRCHRQRRQLDRTAANSVHICCHTQLAAGCQRSAACIMQKANKLIIYRRYHSRPSIRPSPGY